jgi:hypothetical protein
MTADDYAEFFRRLGHRVVRTPCAHWYDTRGGLFTSLPHSVMLEPEADEVAAVLTRGHGWGVRFPAPAEGAGRLSYALVADGPYDIAGLSANSRSKVRRGLKRCEVRRLEPADVRSRGARAHADTLARLRLQHDPYPWARWWDAVGVTRGVEVWGALIDGDIAAYLVVAVVDDGAEILVERSRNDALGHYPNNALVFTVAEDLLGRPGLEHLFFGLESLESSAAGIDRFKASLGFRQSPLRQRIVLHGLAERVLRLPLVARGVRAAAQRWPQRETLRKLEGLLLFHGSLAEHREASKETSWTS